MFATIFSLQPQDWGDLAGVLLWIATGPGGVFLAMYVLSYIAETVPGWHNLPEFLKRVTPVVIALLLSLGAQYALQKPDVIAVLQPFWALLILIFAGVGASLMGHRTAEKAGASHKAKAKAK